MYPKEYRQFFVPMLNRLGAYCCYCERHINVAQTLHMEHIQPKSRKKALKLKWGNLLLACAECNSMKTNRPISLQNILLPDRDNTFLAFDYEYGEISVSAYAQQQGLQQIAQNTLDLFQFNNSPDPTRGNLDITIQRKCAWAKFTVWKDRYARNQTPDMLASIISYAESTGFFSIWMKVFENYPEVRNALIDAFPSTRASACFDENGQPVSPCPNPDNLPHGGKI